jgi:hypothetical protein
MILQKKGGKRDQKDKILQKISQQWAGLFL